MTSLCSHVQYSKKCLLGTSLLLEFESSFSFTSRRFTSLHFIYLSFFFNPLGSLSFHKSFYSVIPVSLMGGFKECPLTFSLCWNSSSNQSQFILIQLLWIILRFEWPRTLTREFFPFMCELFWLLIASELLEPLELPFLYPTRTIFLHRL